MREFYICLLNLYTTNNTQPKYYEGEINMLDPFLKVNKYIHTHTHTHTQLFIVYVKLLTGIRLTRGY
jgi:hypothetical protein